MASGISKFMQLTPPSHFTQSQASHHWKASDMWQRGFARWKVRIQSKQRFVLAQPMAIYAPSDAVRSC